jgi:hypothetical protein
MGEMKGKPIPENIMHKSAITVNAELTTTRELKARFVEDIEVVNLTGTKKEPLPISRATTELRRAYPYIFDCAAYAKTHSPERIETDEFYSRFPRHC